MQMITSNDYLQTLSAWIPKAARYLYRFPDDSGLTCYGIGNHGHWAMQANTTAFSAFAVLSQDSQTDIAVTQMSRDELLHTALGMLRFTLKGHHSGGGTCTDGRSWGHSWISVLCLERMMHAVEALDPHLSDSDRELFRTVLVSESDWLLAEYPVKAGLVENNKPESNMWNGAFLHRTAMLYPDAHHAAEYREKGTRFLLNAISVPSDASSQELVSGRTVAEWHVGANFYDTFGCNHHGYMNVGYMVITLSNAAMLYFSCRHLGLPVPDGFFHHLYDLWRLVKSCTFPDGRLMRIGGDTRVRYCYCQDYAIPVWLMLRDHFGETDCEAYEAGWLKQVRTEMANNGDGSFMGDRLRPMAAVSPLYYTRLEGDKAVTLSMGAYWRRRYGEFADVPAAEKQSPAEVEWHDPYHGACLVRGPRRSASWVWIAGERPQGLCLPSGASDLAEWRTHLAGRIWGTGQITDTRVSTHKETMFPGGFATCGQVILRSDGHFAEGESPEDVAIADLAVVALPDEATLVGFQRARTPARVFLTEVKGLYLLIPNDLFNAYSRHYSCAEFEGDLSGRDTVEETLKLGPWLNVDGRLGLCSLYGGENLLLYRPGRRQITIRSPAWYFYASQGKGLNRVDEICLGRCVSGMESFDAGTVLFDLGFALRAGSSADSTRAWSAAQTGLVSRHCIDTPDLRAVYVLGEDENLYVAAANFADTDIELSAVMADTDRLLRVDTQDSSAGPRGENMSVPAKSCGIWRVNH